MLWDGFVGLFLFLLVVGGGGGGADEVDRLGKGFLLFWGVVVDERDWAQFYDALVQRSFLL